MTFELSSTLAPVFQQTVDGKLACGGSLREVRREQRIVQIQTRA
jgi:hypothetical protein